MENKKLIIITGNLGSGGLERITSNIARRYSKKGWRVRILTLLDMADEPFVDIDESIEIVKFNKFSSRKLDKLSKILLINKWIKFIEDQFNDFVPSNVLCMTLKIASLALKAKKRTKLNFRIVLREISDPKSPSRSQLENHICFKIAKDIDGIIFQTEWEKKCYPKIMQDKGSVIPNPVSVNIVANRKNKTFVTMGRLCLEQKAQNVLIDAFYKFHQFYPEFKLEIYGEGPDKVKVTEMIKNYGLSDYIILCGARKDVHERISESFAFILTSVYEGLSNALVEAMLIGLPCISSDWPGVEDVIKHNTNGLIFPRGNAEKLCECMKYLVENQYETNTMAENGKNQKEYYSFENVFPKYEKIIEGEKYE